MKILPCIGNQYYQYYLDPGYPPISGTYGLVHDYCGTGTGVPILKYAIASQVHYMQFQKVKDVLTTTLKKGDVMNLTSDSVL